MESSELSSTDNLKDSQLRVLYLDGSMKFGGAAKGLSLLLKGLSKVKPILITYQYQEITDKWFNGIKVYRFKRILNYRVRNRLGNWLQKNIPVLFARRLAMIIFSLFSKMEGSIILVRVIFIAKHNRINLIHMNTGFGTLDGLTAARILKIPCVVHLRGFFQPNKKSILRSMNYAAHVIGVSNAVSNGVCRYGMADKKVTTIYDIVDVLAFEKAFNERDSTRKGLGLKETDIAVGIFGRVIPWKGQLEFVYAVLNSIKINQNIKAIIIGDEADGLPEYFNQIKEVTANSGHGDHFIFTGYKEDVENFYAAMDIIVHASIEPEPFGMVVIEGMAASRPVVATDAGGPSEVINSNLDGILVPPGDIEKMSAAILELANDPEKREAMGRNGYDMVRTRFTIENAASKVENIYNGLINHTI